jgi:general secretion pathway protein G
MMQRRSGFSLVELLVVLAIMAVLASVAMPLTEISHRRSQEEELRRSLREIRSALDTFKRMVDMGRISRPAGSSGYPPSLAALVDGVADAQSPQGTKIYLLRRLPRDPFSPADEKDPALTWGLRSYASPPQDPQPGDDVFDVYSKAEGTGLNGVPYRRW